MERNLVKRMEEVKHKVKNVKHGLNMENNNNNIIF